MGDDERIYLLQRRTWFQYALRRRRAVVGRGADEDGKVHALRAQLSEISAALEDADSPPAT